MAEAALARPECPMDILAQQSIAACGRRRIQREDRASVPSRSTTNGFSSDGILKHFQNLHSISRALSDDDAHRGDVDGRSVHPFSVKPRTFDESPCGIGD